MSPTVTYRSFVPVDATEEEMVEILSGMLSDRDAVADELGITVEELDALVDEGKFPKPVMAPGFDPVEERLTGELQPWWSTLAIWDFLRGRSS